VLEFLYSRELAARSTDSSVFLGLAEIRLEEGQANEALTLLRRMQMAAGLPFESLAPAADVLARFGRTEDAAAFLAKRVEAVPWDDAARLRLAEMRSNTAELSAIASNRNAIYEVRAQAARSLGKVQPGTRGLGSAELDALAAAKPVEGPRYFWSRIDAAAQAADPAAKSRLLLSAIAIAPERPEPRIPAFRALTAAGRDTLALVVMEGQHEPVLASDIAQAQARLGRFEEALTTLRRVREAAPSPALDAQIAALERRNEIKATNARRQPRVSAEVQQPEIVRPRLAVQGGAL
jgi:tetratricopeptide (TPR) repeat protein